MQTWRITNEQTALKISVSDPFTNLCLPPSSHVSVYWTLLSREMRAPLSLLACLSFAVTGTWSGGKCLGLWPLIDGLGNLTFSRLSFLLCKMEAWQPHLPFRVIVKIWSVIHMAVLTPTELTSGAWRSRCSWEKALVTVFSAVVVTQVVTQVDHKYLGHDHVSWIVT